MGVGGEVGPLGEPLLRLSFVWFLTASVDSIKVSWSAALFTAQWFIPDALRLAFILVGIASSG